MTVFRKILSGYLLLIFFGVIIGLLGTYYVYGLNQITQSILVRDLPSKQLVTQLMDTFLSQIRYERQYRVLRDAEFLRFFDELGHSFDKMLNEIEGMAEDQSQKKHVALVRDLHQQYSRLFHLQAGSMPKNLAGTVQQDEQLKALFNEITKALQEMAGQSEQLLKGKMEKSNMLAQSAMSQTLVILGFLVFLGTGAALLLAKRISHPIKELRKATTALSYGAFDYPLKFRSNDEIGILTTAFIRMSEKLKEADRLKENFISNITHELKTPLTSLTEAARLILEKVAGPVTEKQAKLLVIIEKDAKRQLRLINDLLELSRMRAGMLTLQMEPWDLEGLAKEAVESLNLMAVRKGLQLKLEMEHVPEPFLIDGNRIYQVLTNLISNALKFTSPGGKVTVSIRERSTDEMQVSVTDTGVGISKEDQQRIFDRFYQLETQPLGKVEGSGLGLSIARHIIKAHGGGIWVESEPQQGSTFFFVLPIRRTIKMGNEGSLTLERAPQQSVQAWQDHS